MDWFTVAPLILEGDEARSEASIDNLLTTAAEEDAAEEG